jgi:hypothetical protein
VPPARRARDAEGGFLSLKVFDFVAAMATQDRSFDPLLEPAQARPPGGRAKPAPNGGAVAEAFCPSRGQTPRRLSGGGFETWGISPGGVEIGVWEGRGWRVYVYTNSSCRVCRAARPRACGWGIGARTSALCAPLAGMQGRHQTQAGVWPAAAAAPLPNRGAFAVWYERRRRAGSSWESC